MKLPTNAIESVYDLSVFSEKNQLIPIICENTKMFRVEFDRMNKVWKSYGPPQIYDPSISLGEILLRSMELHGSKIAQVSIKIRIQLIENASNFHFRCHV